MVDRMLSFCMHRRHTESEKWFIFVWPGTENSRQFFCFVLLYSAVLLAKTVGTSWKFVSRWDVKISTRWHVNCSFHPKITHTRRREARRRMRMSIDRGQEGKEVVMLQNSWKWEGINKVKGNKSLRGMGSSLIWPLRRSRRNVKQFTIRGDKLQEGRR